MKKEHWEPLIDRESGWWYVNHYFLDKQKTVRRETICDFLAEEEAVKMCELFNTAYLRRRR